MNLKSLLFISLCFLFFINTQNANAINADIVVAIDGSGDFTKIQDAIDAVPSNQTDRRTIIFIKSGLYNTEKLIVPTNKINVTIIGESRDQTIVSYHIYDCTNVASGNKCPAEDVPQWTGDNIRTSATLTIMGEGFRAENLTIRNTAGPVGQALAITVQADKTVFINCDILGYQDTIYLWSAAKRSYFEGCLVLGRTDYIYGAGIGYFEACEIRSYGGGYITAPSTPKTQNYGFVFNNCEITYASGSPRSGDDGLQFAMGRPWHEYPKVAWLNCEMTEMLDPLGWPTTWNMDYAATSTDLHLYEYNNTGAGADMSGRAKWAGIKALTAEEAANYTAEKVLNGTDGWAPWEEAPAVKTYEWDGGGNNTGWLTPENWNPDGVPATAEVANITGNYTIDANGGTFTADLNLKAGAVLNISTSSTIAYAACEDATISSSVDVSLSGKIATKDTLFFNVSSNLNVDAKLFGIHKIVKRANGSVTLNADNSNFSGLFIVNGGTLIAPVANSLGKGNVEVSAGSTLKVDHESAFFPEASLTVVNGATLNLNATVTLSEFYIDGSLQGVSAYNATTNPGLITGTGSIIVGRPSSFKFTGGTWDNVGGYSPSLLPEAGETVYCEGEMETSGTVNQANVIFVKGKGKLRLRGVHTSTGTLTFEGGNRISYATGGTGFTLDAPIILNDDINFEMNSGNADGSIMKLLGTISGEHKIIVKNTKTGLSNTSKVWLEGDNSNFSGTWDVSTHASDANGVTGIVGASANAYGNAAIIIGAGNFAQFDITNCVSESNTLTLSSGGKAIVNANIKLGKLTLGNSTYNTGTFTATTNPEFIEGTGSILLEGTSIIEKKTKNFKPNYENGTLFLGSTINHINIYSLTGKLIESAQVNGNSVNIHLPAGFYIIVNDKSESGKLVIK